MKRLTMSLFGDEIAEKLRKQQPWLQSEDLPEFFKFFVGDEFLDAIDNNSNHLICGRRGTGKTHLFGAFRERLRADTRRRQLCISLSCADFAWTPPGYPVAPSPAVRSRYARAMFREFLKVFADRLTVEIDHYANTKARDFLSKKEIPKIARKSDDLQLALLDCIYHGTLEPVEGAYEASASQSTTYQHGLSGDFSLTLSSEQLGGSVHAAGESADQEKQESTRVVKETGILLPHIRHIRSLLLEILDVWRIDCLHILLDEWMQIDKGLTLQIQPYCAELLKHLLFNERRFAVKIATIWHKTDLYDRRDVSQSKGVELGQDILLGLDLDTALFGDDRQVAAFFERMLFKRICHSVPVISALEKDGIINSVFIKELFDSPRNFAALIIASHGIPRAFMNIFHKCASRFKMNFKEQAIYQKEVFEAARDMYLHEKRKTLDKSSADQQLYDLIGNIMSATKQRVFLVPNADAKTSLLLRKLVDEELVHPIASAKTPRALRDTYKAYYVDFGNYCDWRVSRGDDIAAIEEHLVPRIPEEALEPETRAKYILDVSAVAADRLVCEFCGRGFLADHPVYRTKGLCPFCACPPSCAAALMCDICGKHFPRTDPVYLKFCACPHCAQVLPQDKVQKNDGGGFGAAGSN